MKIYNKTLTGDIYLVTSYEQTDSSTEYTDHIIWKEFIKKVSSYIGINSITKRAKKGSLERC